MGLLVAIAVIIVGAATAICFFGWFFCVLWLMGNSPAVGIILIVLSFWITQKFVRVSRKAWANVKYNAGIKPKQPIAQNLPTSLD